MFRKRTLHIGCWNINGFKVKGFNKYSDPKFIKEIVNKDIFCLLETHCSLQDSLTLLNFKSVHLNRPKNRKTNKISGGLSVFIKSELQGGIKFLEHKSNDYIWLKLCGNYFGMRQDLYLCFLYNPPANSSYTQSLDEDLLDIIENDIINYSKKGKIIIMGDMNARTGHESDFIENENYDLNIPLFENYTPDLSIPNRYSRDTTILTRGRALNDLCIQTGLRILNGRCIGDFTGNFTCHNYRGSSTVDYGIVSESFIEQVKFFSVNEFLPDLSDHCQISLLFEINCILNREDKTKIPLPVKYVWTEQSSALYQQALASNELQSKLSYIVNNDYNSDIDGMVSDMNQVLCKAADSAGCKPPNKSVRPISRHLPKKPKWYDVPLSSLKRSLDNKLVLFKKYNKDPIIRGSFYSALKLYRKARKQKIREYYSSIVDQLDALRENKPKEYWSLLGNLVNSSSTNGSDISPDTWYSYFSDLNKKPYRISLEIFNKLRDAEKDKVFSELDNRITEKEIADAISTLKNNKSSSFDLILNEMLKSGITFLLKPLSRIFNYILCNGEFPKIWARGIIVPVFKNGSKDDPANYRGLTIGSNICKLFTKILNTRLDQFCIKRNLICPEQIGFCKGKRTSDHIFVLKTLIDKYTQHGKKQLYTCFVDLRRAFDTVRHEELFFKLRKCGISDLFYRVLKDMYHNIDLCVKVDSNYLSQNFSSYIGVRQGDNLRPNLFKLFVNDIPDIFDSNCHPVLLNSTKLNCLMYADDLVLLSESPEGLQQCLTNLYDYCQIWGLEVNVKKTKSIIFNKTGRIVPASFRISDDIIDNVKNYSYLGVNFSNSGSFTFAKQTLYEKGLKAYFKFRKSFQHHKPKVKTLLHVFDHTIKPVILYGSEIWGTFSTEKMKKLQDRYFNTLCSNLPAEKLHIKFCKYVLEVNKRSTNLAILGELGRYPLILEIFVTMIKFWKRISTLNTSDIISEAYSTSKKLHYENKSSWYNSIVEIINYFQLDENKILNLKGTLKNYLYEKLKLRYNDLWTKHLFDDIRNSSGGNKLRTYRLFKDKFSFENYLNWGTFNQRKVITKFRISAHNLEVERGRYKNIPFNQRTCNLCKSTVENEIHFLLECPSLHLARNDILHVIETKYTGIRSLDNKAKFVWLMSAEDPFVYKHLHSLLVKLNSVRQDLLNNNNIVLNNK